MKKKHVRPIKSNKKIPKLEGTGTGIHIPKLHSPTIGSRSRIIDAATGRKETTTLGDSDT